MPEDGPGAYVEYDSDAALASDELGMNTFRMSIEWSRIFPNSTAVGGYLGRRRRRQPGRSQALDALANQDEVEHYRAVFASLRAHGLEPLVTVNHFTLPAWVHDPITTRPLIQLGLPAPAAGWLSPITPVEFEKYAAYVAWKYGDQVDNWATINEPFSPVLTEFLAIPAWSQLAARASSGPTSPRRSWSTRPRPRRRVRRDPRGTHRRDGGPARRHSSDSPTT